MQVDCGAMGSWRHIRFTCILHLAALHLAALGLGGCTWSDLSWAQQSESDRTQRPPYLEEYISAHYRDLGNRFVKCISWEKFEQRLSGIRVLFLGDHHRDGSLHRKVLGLLARLCDRDHRLVLGLEAVGVQDNVSLQEYLSGWIPLAELRRRIAGRWPDSWLENPKVDHKFFCEVLQLARRRSLIAFPLEPTPRAELEARDTVIAKSIKRSAQAHPDRMIVVLVGHAHLMGQGHLVGRVALPSMQIGARMSDTLLRSLQDFPSSSQAEFLETDTGVLFFDPREPN